MVGKANKTRQVEARSNGFQKIPLPPDLQRDIPLTENARTVLRKRYLRRGEDGQPVETEPEMFWRVAYHVAKAEAEHGGDVEAVARQFYDLLTGILFLPNSPTFTGAGTPLGQLSACFVLAIDDDMGRTGSGIFETLRDAALIQQTGGGNGFAFSRLRPKGALVRSSNGEATGPVGFLRVYDQAFGEIAQGGSRRGANMAVLRVDHPDIREFVTCKTDENQITNFNISVGITDAFMQAVQDDGNFELVNPQDGKVWETVRARDLFDLIVRQAHHNGEPGVLFLDTANRENPVPHLYELEATNPCVTGDTLVATPSGWRRVDEIRAGDEICTVLGTGHVAEVEVNEAVPVYKVHFSDGGVVKVTAAHQFHARDSRTKFFEPRRVDELKVGDWVRVFHASVPNNPVPQGCVQLDDRDYGFLVGVLVGDGSYTPSRLSKNVVRVSSHADETEWNAILERTFAKVGAEKVSTYVNQGSRSMMMDPKPGRVVAEWVRSLPLTPARGPGKTLPECYINSNREFLVGLLDGLFSTDGSVDLSANHPLVRFHTSSEQLAHQVRRMLLMFGIHARISQSVRERYSIDGREIRCDRPKYNVIISGESFGRFFEQIRLTHPDKQYRMEEAALCCNFTGGNWAAKVVAIEPAGVETVYDLHEPRSDTWITEGYVSRGCGEQWLGPYENCCLGSINLAKHIANNGVDWEKLRATVERATRFLDDVVTANAYVPAVPQLKEAAFRVRRIGLGIMGLADMMYILRVRYGSVEGQEFASQVIEFVRFHAMRTSIALAEERGPFAAIAGSIYDPNALTWQPPKSLVPYTHDWGRPPLDWSEIVAGIRQHGMRNGAQLTVAPTGTISTVAGCEGYGCEPVFALAYTRYVNDKGRQIALQYTSPLFEHALREAGLDDEAIRQVVEQVNQTGTCQHVTGVPEHLRRVFVVSGDVTAEEHVRMQAALQAFTDNAISKTINCPANATEKDVADAYMLGWKLGCKGLTVYVTGSREKVVLETAETAQKKQQDSGSEPVMQTRLFNEEKKPRPRRLLGKTYRVATPLGATYVTVNENGDGGNQPFEVFIHTAKAGSETAAVSEALGRLISYILRLVSPVDPRNRLKETVRQLAGIGGVRSIGFGPSRVSSLPDGVAQVLQEYIDESEINTAETGDGAVTVSDKQLALPVEPPKPLGDLCPECGAATLVNEEGCRKCYSCGFSEC
jgi:ribonucleotide reductase alpha subunit